MSPVSRSVLIAKKKNILRTLFVSLILCSCSSPKKRLENQSEKQVKILIVGNSYIAISMKKDKKEIVLNNTPTIIQQLLGAKYEIASCTHGGYSLRDHYETVLCRDIISGKKWDYILLQEKSGRYTSTKSDLEKIKLWNPKANFLFFQNWQKKGEHLYLSNNLGMNMIKVGEEWFRLQGQYPLYSNDNSHPSPFGIYLTALVVAQYFSKVQLNEAGKSLVLLKEIEKNQKEFGDDYPLEVDLQTLKKLQADLNRE